MTKLRERDVVSYDPPPKTGWLAGSDPRWCVEGLGVVHRRDDGSLFVVDTFWGGGEEHVFRPDEIAPTVLFNLDDYEKVPAHHWERYAPADRGLITRQHRLQAEHYVRRGAVEDQDTIVAKARERWENAETDARDARARADRARQSLDNLLLGDDPA